MTPGGARSLTALDWQVGRAVDGRRVVVLEGDLDLATSSAAEQALRRGIEEHDGSFLIVDLTGLRFMDCAGVRVIVRAREALRSAGSDLRIRIPASGVVTTILEVLGEETGLVDTIEG